MNGCSFHKLLLLRECGDAHLALPERRQPTGFERGSPLRHLLNERGETRIERRVEGMAQKALTQCLRRLERKSFFSSRFS